LFGEGTTVTFRAARVFLAKLFPSTDLHGLGSVSLWNALIHLNSRNHFSQGVLFLMLAAGLNFACVHDLLERWVVFVLGIVFRPVSDAWKLNDAFLLRCRGPQIVGLVVTTLCQEVGVLHHSVLVRAVNGQIFHIGLVAGNRVALVVLGDESLSVLARESRKAQRVGRIVRIQQTGDAQFVVGLRQAAEWNITVLLAEIARLIREFRLGVDILQVFHKIRFGERLWRVDVFFLVFRFAGLGIERNSSTRCLKLQMKRIQVEHFAGWTGFWTSFVVQSRVVILLVGVEPVVVLNL